MSDRLNLTHKDIASAMRNSVKVAKYGTPEQKAGMFRPNLPAQPAPAKDQAS